MFKILSAVIILSLFVQNGASSQWVDPHDMNIIIDGLEPTKFSKGKSTLVTDCDCSNTRNNPSSDENLSSVYLKRVISLLLNSATVDHTNSKLRKGKFVIDTEHENYKFLLDFANSQERSNEETFRILDKVLSELLFKTSSDELHDFLISTQERLIMILFDKTAFIIYGTLVAVYITYHLFQAKYSFWYILRYFTIIIFLIDYGYRYQELLQEAEKQNIRIQSPECQKMGWFAYYFFNKGNCEKKVVNPLDVLLLQVKSTFSSFGGSMGSFAKELFENLPFPWNILIFPIMLLFLVIMSAIIMTIVNGYSFKINLMHLFHFEFGDHHHRTTENNFNQAFMDKILDAVSHRRMVEDTRSPKKETAVEKSNAESKVKDKQKKRKENKDGSKVDKGECSKVEECEKQSKENVSKTSPNMDSNEIKNLETQEGRKEKDLWVEVFHETSNDNRDLGKRDLENGSGDWIKQSEKSKEQIATVENLSVDDKR